MALKPRSNAKNQHQSSWQLGLPPLNKGSRSSVNKRNAIKLASVVSAFCFILYIISHFFTPSSLNSKHTYPKSHGYYLNELPASSRLIFPHAEHAPLLKEIGVKGLYILRLEMDGSKRFVLKPEDKPLTDEEKKKTTDSVLLVKKAFLDHGKLVYRKKNDTPETVIVSLIDFENFELDTIVNIVQNRVDYAQKHNYGVYIRWIQEFIPLLDNQNLEASYEFIKPLMMRAAMHAFPRAKNFVFVDNESLITNIELSIESAILDPSILELGLVKNKPITAGCSTNTYSNLPTKDVSFVFPQDVQGRLDLSTFVIANDVYGRAFLEYLCDPLVKNFPWVDLVHSFGHILQWHPTLLGQTAIVVPKIMASNYDATKLEGAKDSFHYTAGDLIASFKGCRKRNTCTQEIGALYELIKRSV